VQAARRRQGITAGCPPSPPTGGGGGERVGEEKAMPLVRIIGNCPSTVMLVYPHKVKVKWGKNRSFRKEVLLPHSMRRKNAIETFVNIFWLNSNFLVHRGT
jgi:hypothetical protein